MTKNNTNPFHYTPTGEEEGSDGSFQRKITFVGIVFAMMANDYYVRSSNDHNKPIVRSINSSDNRFSPEIGDNHTDFTP